MYPTSIREACTSIRQHSFSPSVQPSPPNYPNLKPEQHRMIKPLSKASRRDLQTKCVQSIPYRPRPVKVSLKLMEGSAENNHLAGVPRDCVSKALEIVLVHPLRNIKNWNTRLLFPNAQLWCKREDLGTSTPVGFHSPQDSCVERIRVLTPDALLTTTVRSLQPTHSLNRRTHTPYITWRTIGWRFWGSPCRVEPSVSPSNVLIS